MVKLNKEQKEAVNEMVELYAGMGELETKKNVLEYCRNETITCLIQDRLMVILNDLGMIVDEEERAEHVD